MEDGYPTKGTEIDTAVPYAATAAPISQAPHHSPQTSGKAVASLVCGIVGLVFSFLGIIMGPIAICLGVQARREIRNSQGRIGGDGLALAGIITGGIGAIIGLIMLIFAIMLSFSWAFE